MNRLLRTRGRLLEPLERRDLLSAEPTGVAAAGEPAEIQFRLTIADEDGLPLSEVEVGDSFQLQVHVQDLRGNAAAGVFSPYLDVVYDQTLARLTGDVQFGSVYVNAQSADTSQAGLIDEAGGFGSFQTFQSTIHTGGAGGDPHFLWSVPLIALASGELHFAGNAADVRPLHDLYVYDSTQLVTADRVDYGQTSLTITPAQSVLVDNGAEGFRHEGAWTRYRRLGHDRDLHFSAPGEGADQAHWKSPADPGMYRIAATWRGHPNRASDAPYRVYAEDQMLEEIRVNQTLEPNDVVFAGSNWEVLGVFEVTGQPLSVVLSDDADGFVIADAIWFERLDASAAASTATLELRHDGNLIESGAEIDFGNRGVGEPALKHFTLANRSDSPISLQPLRNLSMPPGFRVAADVPSTWLSPGASTNFTLELLTRNPQQASGAITLSSVGGDDLLQLHLRGSVRERETPSRSLPRVQVVDDGDAGFAALGRWKHYFGIGRHRDVRFSAQGGGHDVARWSFDVEPGTYRFATSWAAHPNRATDAPYVVHAGGEVLGHQRINQRNAPNDFAADGGVWELIGTYEVDSDSLVVELNDAANGFVIADAVRVERMDASLATSSAADVQIVDNGESGFQSVGRWKDYGGIGLARDVAFHGAGSGHDVARWTFMVTPGSYRIATTWSPHPNRATNAPYEIRDSSGSLSRTRVNQQRMPADFRESTTRWEDLGTVVVSGSTLTVELSDAANGFVIADAVRIERV